MQNKFAAIHEQVGKIKCRYQQSLTDLEALYGALSQKAFNDKLDLSRVPLPTEPTTKETESLGKVTDRNYEVKKTFKLPAPQKMGFLKTTEGRKSLFDQWIDAWLMQESVVLTAESFMEAAKTCLWELTKDKDVSIGVAEYDVFSKKIFDALEKGHLAQNYDGTNNCVRISGKME